MAARTRKEPSFEEGLGRLEAIADAMEQNALPLEQLLKLYEEGMKLSETLTAKLDAAGARMQEVRAGKDGAPVLKATDIVSQMSLLDQADE